MQRIVIVLFVSIGLLLGGCTATKINRSIYAQPLSPYCKWGVVPLANYTQSPQVGEKAAAITAGLLKAYGINNVVVYHRPGSCKTVLTCPHQIMSNYQMRLWARKAGVKYVMTGAVNEWRYKVGLDGEPAVSLTLNVIDVRSGKMVWSTVGSKVGGSRESIGVIAHELINGMLNMLVLSK
ncbi:MAG: penicillin-binding protein activator LpoB [Gammaproteobacteria bacterium]|jgi:TolB-like protein